MRYHQVYRLVDPRYPLEDPRHIRYVGRTSRKLSDQLNKHLLDWPMEGGLKRKWLEELSLADAEPAMIVVEKVQSSHEAKERTEHWIRYYEGQGYELINSQTDDSSSVWNRQRVIEDFRMEVMRLLLGQDSLYCIAMQKLSEEGQEGSALYLYLQAAETPDLSIEEIPALFRERDERVKGLEHEVMRAIDSGKIQGPIVSALREAIEEGKQAMVEEEGSALERYVRMTEQQGDENLVFYLGKEPSAREREKTEVKIQEAKEKGWRGFRKEINGDTKMLSSQ